MGLQPYGTTLVIAILLGAYVSSVEARHRGQNSQLVWDALPWVLLFGLLGARAYHVLSLAEFYRANPLAVLFLGNGGLGIYGALGGGLVSLGIWKGIKGLKGIRGVGELLDIAAPGLAVGQAVGRFANFFSRELYGFPTSLPWGIYIAPEKRFPGLTNFSFFHPLFLYESLWNLLNFVILLKIAQKFRPKLLPGELFLLYLSIYALGRFFLEGLRIESWMIEGVRVAQGLSVLLVFGSILITFLGRGKGRELKLGI